jgi:hypothetical protein
MMMEAVSTTSTTAMQESSVFADDEDDANKNNNKMTTTTLVEKIAYRDALGRPGLFTGTMVDDMAVQGTMDYNEPDEMMVRRYTGLWDSTKDRGGHWHDDTAAARIEYQNGDVYTGQVHHSNKTGSGVYRWTNGRTYTGEYDADHRHGRGRYEWPDGQVYIGDFCHNRREGHGTYQTQDGQVRYTGQWIDGQYEGHGTYGYVDPITHQAMVYTGEFHAGRPHGRGHEETTRGEIIRQGIWQDGIYVDDDIDDDNNNDDDDRDKNTEQLHLVLDQPWFDATTHVPTIYRGLMNDGRQPHGNGTAVYKTTTGDNIFSYEGCWDNGRYHGHGRLLYSTGEEYCGDFVHGDRHGTGTFKWSDGRQYCGDFVHNQRTGHGIFTWASGDRYDGEFVNGKRSGYGTFIFDNGAYYSGEWQQGQYHGRGKTVDTTGASYVGDFCNGQRHGVGEELDPYGRVAYSGHWSQGVHESSPDYIPPPVVVRDHGHELSVDDEPTSYDSSALRVLQHRQEQQQPDATESPKNGARQLTNAAAITTTTTSTSSGGEIPRSQPPSVPPPAVPGQRLLRTWQAAESAAPPPQQQRELIEHDDCMAVVDRKVTDGLGCPGLYTGIVWKKNFQPHGVGRLVYIDGKRIHEGFWQYGNKEGHGRCLFLPQYDFHEGEYLANLRHGPGRYSVRLITVRSLNACGYENVCDCESLILYSLSLSLPSSFCCGGGRYDSGKTAVNMWASTETISGTDMASSPMPMEHDTRGAFLLLLMFVCCRIHSESHRPS